MFVKLVYICVMEDFRKETQEKLLKRLNTIASLVEDTGISAPTWRKLKSGKGDISISMIKKMSRILDTVGE